jgi:hypothetical protein
MNSSGTSSAYASGQEGNLIKNPCNPQRHVLRNPRLVNKNTFCKKPTRKALQCKCVSGLEFGCW